VCSSDLDIDSYLFDLDLANTIWFVE
jgi:hypothetical protein